MFEFHSVKSVNGMVIDVTSIKGPFKAERLWMLRWLLLQAKREPIAISCSSPSAA